MTSPDASAAAEGPPATTRTGPQQRPAVPRRVWQVTTVVVVGAFMTQLDGALVNVGLATVADDLHASLRSAQWIVSGYLLALVAGLPLCGWAARRLGAGRLWMWSLAGFTGSSLLCAVADDLPQLIVFRILQGLSGGLLLPAGQTVIAQAAGRGLMGRVMSTAGMALVLGPAAGPVLGGLLIAHASWPWLFLVNVPVGLAGWWFGRRLVPPGEPADGAGFDVPGFVLVALGLSAATYAVSVPGQSRGLTLTGFYGPLLVGCAALAAFGMLSRRRTAPVLNTGLFANSAFSAAAAASFLAGAIQFGALVIWPLYFQLVRGDGVIGTGLAMVGFAVGAATLPLSGRLTDRFGGGPVSLAGGLVTALAFVAAALLPSDAPLLALEACLLLLGIGNALSVVPSSTAAYVTVAPAQLPDAVTLINIFLRLGGAVGAALLVSVLSGGDGGPGAAASYRTAFSCLVLLSVLAVAASACMVLALRGGAGRRGESEQ
ncbi:DHA2 family efflux MFS transporter permease subunit [Streptomyces sp. BH097]|uniref:DHA2 family efflux MFS transporter permease subunit n=1 Tax=unclassified Streptomyces TaxID=2593676 RepID=UPI003BB538B5